HYQTSNTTGPNGAETCILDHYGNSDLGVFSRGETHKHGIVIELGSFAFKRKIILCGSGFRTHVDSINTGNPGGSDLSYILHTADNCFIVIIRYMCEHFMFLYILVQDAVFRRMAFHSLDKMWCIKISFIGYD